MNSFVPSLPVGTRDIPLCMKLPVLRCIGIDSIVSMQFV